MTAVFAVLRAYAVLNVGAVRWLDSASYFDFDLLGRAERLWTVPLFFGVVPGGDGWLVLAHVLVATACWGFLAAVIAHLVRKPVLARVSAAAVLVLGLTVQVTEWDITILSESLAISLTVATIAALLLVVQRPSRPTLGLLLGLLSAWAFTRHVNVVLLAVVVPFALLACAACRPRAIAIGFGAGLLALTAWGLFAVSQEDTIWRYNSYVIITQRLLDDPDSSRYLRAHGLPDSPGLAIDQRVAPSPTSPTFRSPAMQQWLETSWRDSYIGLIVRHPTEAVTDPLADANGILSAEPPYAQPRTVLPGPMQDVAYGRSPGELPWLVAMAVGVWLLSLALRLRPTRIDAVAWSLVGVAAIWFWLVWHTAASELERLMVPVSVTLRIAMLILLIVAVDRLLARGARERRPSAEPQPA